MKDLTSKRILVTGVSGQVGGALSQQLQGQCELITAARKGADIDLDVTKLDQIKAVITDLKPDIIINPAAYTQVDQAEDEPEQARAINARAPEVLAELSKKHDALLVHYSTDYVFNGQGSEPCKEDDDTDPINVYGQTKLEGEQAIQAIDCDHFIFRTCWVYDAHGKNFPNAILNRARTMETLKVVNDQIGTPTSADFIAEVTLAATEKNLQQAMAGTGRNRLYNLRPEGQCSWYEFAQEIVRIGRQHQQLAVQDILAVPSSEFPTKAQRPNWSVLAIEKLKTDFQISPEHWAAYAERTLKP